MNCLAKAGAKCALFLRTIEPGELILQSKVTGFGGSSRMATRVAEGKRALTIPINAISGVAGHVQPGDRVDVLNTRPINGQLTTSVILQNILVIATDQRSNTEIDRGARRKHSDRGSHADRGTAVGSGAVGRQADPDVAWCGCADRGRGNHPGASFRPAWIRLSQSLRRPRHPPQWTTARVFGSAKAVGTSRISGSTERRLT